MAQRTGPVNITEEYHGCIGLSKLEGGRVGMACGTQSNSGRRVPLVWEGFVEVAIKRVTS